jgi:membrane protease YdiL (CAAX protease family)
MRLTTEALTPALVLAHLGLVALPEELFFRAYVQRALGDAWGRPWRFLGARLGPGWVTAAILFGIVHLPVSGGGGLLRIAPALVFGWLYARRTCVAGPILFHWACNVAILCVAPKSGYIPGS